MKKVLAKHLFTRVITATLFVAVISLSVPNLASAALVVDLKVNSQDADLTLATSTDTFDISFVATGYSSCQFSSPISSGVTSGFTMHFAPGDQYYPAAGGSTTFAVFCDDLSGSTISDSIIVNSPGTPAGGGGSGTSAGPAVDVKANGSDGTITLSNGGTYNFTWSSSNASSCQQSSPISSGVALNGVSQTFSPGDQYYPVAGSPITITITCNGGGFSVSDSVMVQLANNSGGGGGGGGSSSSSSSSGSSSGSARPIATTTCLLVTQPMGLGAQNDPIEVMKIQSFLRVFMGYNEVEINGVFDNATYNAVGAFQTLYKDEILIPWGISEPTHFVYILSLKKINEIYCHQILPITQAEQQEIASYKALIQNLQNQGLNVEPGATTTASSTVEIPVVGLTSPQGQNFQSLGAALFGLPDNIKDIIPFVLRLILLGAVLYFLASVIWNVLKNKSLRAHIKSWYLVVSARAKSLLKKSPEVELEV